ncbi:DUF4253 domain-containing protein [Streptomyces sparsogenes]|uniref:DUF4253 domain-containing protein n=1 Tax=Streptomyces sparsogenes TaxID=67365 RepID=UPI0033E81395
MSTLHLSVAAAPATEHEALLVAAEHFGLLPGQCLGSTPYTLAAYSERIPDAHHWYF